MTQSIPDLDIRDRAQVEEFFARLEQAYPDVAHALKVMNMSQDQYLGILRAMRQPTSVSTSSAQIQL